MINQLVQISHRLDSIGFHKEADTIDAIIRKYASGQIALQKFKEFLKTLTEVAESFSKLKTLVEMDSSLEYKSLLRMTEQMIKIDSSNWNQISYELHGPIHVAIAERDRIKNKTDKLCENQQPYTKEKWNKEIGKITSILETIKNAMK